MEEDDDPALWNLHKELGGRTMEDDAGNIRVNTKAIKSRYYPFPSLAQLLIFAWAFKHQVSAAALDELLVTMAFVDGESGDGTGEGQGFEATDLPKHGCHFVSRMRKCLPMLEVIARSVPCKGARAEETAEVFDVPIYLILNRLLRSSTRVAEMENIEGGAVFRGDSTRAHGNLCDHVFSGSERGLHEQRSCQMNGRLARRSPYSYDGLAAQSGREVYVNDVVVCEIEQRRRPCRVMGLFWDKESCELCVDVRPLHAARAVLGDKSDEDRLQLVRLWEEVGSGSESVLPVSSLMDLLKIYTSQEAGDGKHNEEWLDGPRPDAWYACA